MSGDLFLHVEIARRLLACGADASRTTADGMTAEDFAYGGPCEALLTG